MGRAKGYLPSQTHFKTMIQNLHQLYHEQLRDLYSAELQIIDGLAEMIRSSTNDRLKEVFSDHLKETQEQRQRLETILGRHDLTPGGEECQAMKGLIKETQQGLQRTEPGPVRDAVLIASANRIEHYEIAGYGVARAFAQCLDLSDDAELLDKTLKEEGAADHKLTELATGSLFRDGINEAATKA
jgi:ferritin-like metal-binding protein YciE